MKFNNPQHYINEAKKQLQNLNEQSQSQSVGQRLKKKLKLLEEKKQQKINPQILLNSQQINLNRDDSNIKINKNVDITELALQKYQQIKKNYNFVSFDQVPKAKQITVGSFQKVSVPIYDFNQQMYKFKRNGYCSNPNHQVKGYVVNDKKLRLNYLNQGDYDNQFVDQNEIIEKEQIKDTIRSRKQITKIYKQKRDKSYDILNYQGPWAGYGEDLQNGALTQGQKLTLIQAQKKKQQKVEQAKLQEQNFQPYSIFHWKQTHDYKGFSWLDPPADFKTRYQGCFLPKKQINTWVGSQKTGYQALRFFPKIGHFLLVGNPEGKIHLYDVNKNRTCAQTYLGHTKAIRDIQFTNDGKHFLSCGFDGSVHYWDTQYGKVNRTFKLKRIPFTAKFHPTKQSSFLVGSNNKKILQFDLNSGTKQFEYSQHLGTINTITFIQQNKFVSTADDKKLFIWQYGIPVVTKHVSEPQMHVITATALHPNGQYLAGQASDNQIVVYENKGGNFRRIRSKKFASHFSAGYACSIDFSNDGQYLISGDQRGKVVFYDWKTAKIYRAIDAHPSVCIGVQWHPTDPNMVASCGWEGLVKLWQ